MSIFQGNDREIDFEEEDTLSQFPDLWEDKEEDDEEEEEDS